MIFQYTVTAVSLATALLSLAVFKLALPDAIRRDTPNPPPPNDELTFAQTAVFLIRRLTLLETFSIRKSIHKITHTFFLGLVILFSSFFPSTVFWGWAIGTLLSSGLYLIVDISLQDRNSSPENTSWKRTLMYSVMTCVGVCGSLIGCFVVTFERVQVMAFVKSVVVSLGIDELVTRPLIILVLSLVLRDSEKMRNLKARYEFLETPKDRIAVLEEPSNEVIECAPEERLPLEEIENFQPRIRKPCLKIPTIEFNSINIKKYENLSDSVDTNRRSNRVRPRRRLLPLLVDFGRQTDKENKNQLKSLGDCVPETSRVRRNRERSKVEEDSRGVQIQGSQEECANTPSGGDLQRKDSEASLAKYQETFEEQLKGCWVNESEQELVEKADKEAVECQMSEVYYFSGNRQEQDVINLEDDTIYLGLKQSQPNINLKPTKSSPRNEDQSQLNEFLVTTIKSTPPKDKDFLHPHDSHSQTIVQQTTITPKKEEEQQKEQQQHQQEEQQIVEEQQMAEGQQKQEIQSVHFSRLSKRSKKLNIFNDSMTCSIDQNPVLKPDTEPVCETFNRIINRSNHLQVIDADLEQFQEVSTPRKNRSNSQDPSRPLKLFSNIKHNNSEMSVMKRSILEVRESNDKNVEMEHIDLNTIDLGNIQERTSKPNPPRKNYKRKNLRLFKSDSPYLEYLPNMLNKEMKSQFSNRKSKENLLDLQHSKYKATATPNYTSYVREF